MFRQDTHMCGEAHLHARQEAPTCLETNTRMLGGDHHTPGNGQPHASRKFPRSGRRHRHACKGQQHAWKRLPQARRNRPTCLDRPLTVSPSAASGWDRSAGPRTKILPAGPASARYRSLLTFELHRDRQLPIGPEFISANVRLPFFQMRQATLPHFRPLHAVPRGLSRTDRMMKALHGNESIQGVVGVAPLTVRSRVTSIVITETLRLRRHHRPRLTLCEPLARVAQLLTGIFGPSGST